MDEPNQQEDGFPIEPGVTKRSEAPLAARAKRESPSRAKGERGRKEPAWVRYFLRSLERTANARASAEEAGIDYTTAYARRRAHAEFAEGWAEALRVRSERVEQEQRLEIEALARGPSTIASTGNGPPPRSGEELVASGGQLKRAGRGRWSARREAIFFVELAASAIVQRAAAAAGISATAVRARRLRHRLFSAKWDAVVRNARASIDLHLVEEAKKTFDPETLETANVAPRVTIDQAIKISQIGASSRKQEEELPDPFADEAARMTPDDVTALRERLVRKLRRMRERDMPDRVAEGWSFDKEHDQMVPPGWVKGD
jgi:hypothetical protein